MTLIPKLPATIVYGGDYNPEQWPEAVWLDDVRLMHEAGVNLVSLAIFSWSRLQPTETTFDFGWLDRIMDLLAANGIHVCLATSTASPPPWLATNYPDVLPVDASGLPLHHGSRSHFSPSSPSYRRFAAELIRRLAERYRDHPALVAWHINNEFACHTAECHSDASTVAFRAWLKDKYGSLDVLNAAWGTDFWSQRYADWTEILTPRRAPYHRNPAQQLDYRRFMSDAFRDIYRLERGLVAKIAPDIPATTNLVWFLRPIDAHRWANDLDFASWDCYPDTVNESGEERFAAVGHDVIRSLKKDRPFLLIEQAPSAVTWRPVNPPKPPGLMRLWSLQAIARGADGVMFFQWRASRTGAEKYLTGMLGHGAPDQSRVFAEIKQLGAELKKLAPLADTLIHARVAIVFSWEVCWALELEGKPGPIDYPGWASALHR
jgi:beta-galactosidase